MQKIYHKRRYIDKHTYFYNIFRKKTVLTTGEAADCERHHYIKKCISTRPIKKNFMRVSLKLRLRHDFWLKKWKISHIKAPFSILRITKMHFSKNAPNVWVYENSLDDWNNMYEESWKEIFGWGSQHSYFFPWHLCS